MVREIRCKMRTRNYWPYPRSATAMWNTKCFMKIEMGNICAKFSRLRKTNERIEVCSIYIYLPTGIVAECQDDRSQHRNKDRAMQVLAARLKDRQEREAQAKEASARKSLIGSGDRSDRIRTYNFPQGRVTDHRINLTLYNLPRIISGDALGEVVDALVAQDQADRLAAFEAADQ